MNNTADLPLWAAFLVAFFLIGGAMLALIGAIGMLRLKNFYERVHAPTLGSTLGVGGVLIASIIFFSITRTRPTVHEVVIAIFLIITTPVTLLLLVRAALHRDRAKGSPDVPGAITFVNGTVHLWGGKAVIAPSTEGNHPQPMQHAELVQALTEQLEIYENLEEIRAWIASHKEAGVTQKAMYRAMIEVVRRLDPNLEDEKYKRAKAIADMISGHIAPHHRIWDTFVL